MLRPLLKTPSCSDQTRFGGGGGGRDPENGNGGAPGGATKLHPQSRQSSVVPTWVALLMMVGACVFVLGVASERYQRSGPARNDEHHQPPYGSSASSSRLLAAGTADGGARGGEKAVAPASGSMVTSAKSMLSPEEDEQLEFDEGGQRYHVLFSTDCSPYLTWQSYLVYFTAMRVRQPGHVTRIVSGCSPEEAEAMVAWFDRSVQFMSRRFHIHFTPKFSEVKDGGGKVTGDYHFFNKPHGLKYWLEHSELAGFQETTRTFQHADDIVILIDPDMLLMRPITKDFSDERDTLISEERRTKVLSTEVKHGVPFAQTYVLGTLWQKFDLDKIAGKDSPAKDVNWEDGGHYYMVGPPYIGTVHDMHRIAVKWSEFVPRVYAQYPELLAEMYAYCIAVAHLGLRHMLIDSLMTSKPGERWEAWPLVDKIPPEQMCEFAQNPDQSRHALPSVLHMCQFYSVGLHWFFGKNKITNDIYDCPTPLFQEPPGNLALMYDYKWPPYDKEKTLLSPKEINENTFMVCGMTRVLNDAAIFHKTATCPPGTANMERSRFVADLFVE